MLKLENIIKDYSVGGQSLRALKGISVDFRKSEFVSILGQSGCGKTTLLNIIGGLDRYSSGDLIINGVSTKEYNDSDWDAYRNHSVGFVFQSYNLIPHQTVLQNVELALSLSGVKKSERKTRAIEALQKVGLGDQLKKKPSEMSGGQMQRVAIARAIVNNPDIILADEPTGALDSETSIQVMEILKEISKDRLVVMVTHNPEIAEQYSTRIIRMLDGEIKSDSNPILEEVSEKPKKEKNKKINKKERKPSLSFATSFGLSLKNLFTKKGRTVLTSFAGSIGIIGIALIFAVSQGMTTYINTVQEETLTSYPLTIEATTVDVNTLMETFMNVVEEKNDHKKDKVYSKSVMFDMINAFNNLETKENDLKSFKKFIDNDLKNKNSTTGLKDALSGVQYTYDAQLQVYTKDADGNVIISDSQKLLSDALYEHFGMDMSSMFNMGGSFGMSSSSSFMSLGASGSSTKLWCEMLSGKDGELINPLLKNQYDLIYGNWPNEENEILLIVDENNEIDDLTLYALGLKPKAEIDEVFKAVADKKEIKTKKQSWSYKEICGMDFRTVLNSECFILDEKTGLYTDLRDTESGLRYLYDKGLTLKVTGIIRPNEDASTTMLTGSIAYTKDLTKYIIEHAKKSKAVKAQLKNDSIDIFTGLPFPSAKGDLTDKEKETEFKEYIDSLNKEEKGKTYIKIKSIPTEKDVNNFVKQTMASLDRETIEETIATAMGQQMSMNQDEILEYTKKMSNDEINELYEEMLVEQYKAQYAQNVASQMAFMTTDQLVMALEGELATFTTKQFAVYHDEILEFSKSTYDDNLLKLGYVNLNDPATINLYASSFENKDVIEAFIEDYNKDVEELSQIKYTDYIGIMMSSITTIINAISYVLIAFVAISLVVSSIMIGVITLISVQERTKEIGILRAIGASKRNVSNMFNAETMIIGFASGLIGIIITYLLCIPINIILEAVTGIPNLEAILPIHIGIILILISVALTLFAGIIPSRSAAKKDPVVALRTE